MISVITQGHKSMFPASDVCRLFFGSSIRIEKNRIEIDCPYEYQITSRVDVDGIVSTQAAGLAGRNTIKSVAQIPANREIKRQLYRVLSEITGICFPWGSLTGIRPTLVASEIESVEAMTSMYDVRPDKAQLAIRTAREEARILEKTDERDVFVYIGIPFCPGRCTYCSFITQDNFRNSGLLPDYCDAVIREIRAMSGALKRVRAVYIGGGTPTVMEDPLLSRFLNDCLGLIRPDEGAEITLEAGRPDTMSEQKLLSIRRAGIGRICINPQTLIDRTLRTIGRKHTSDQFYKAYEWARKVGFSSINTDLIAGLPGETEQDFIYSMEHILTRMPESITVHALCKKRGSNLDTEQILSRFGDEPADGMVTYASSRIIQSGYHPYYLYKQKNTVGALENTGFAKEGKECLYNVAMMSDQRTVIAFGAGISKRLVINGKFKRLDCIRHPREYIDRVEETIRKKIEFFEV
ncbi:MAG: coproporphyrinogen dehydrogenase HemZ [Clostridiaceae bacterium]|nr:coproporphyrinogen dehydrogenase HemZ [Clostridiaceae bacterium]